MTPPYVSHGKGCRIWDLDENEYVDWMMSVGALILGHADDAVDNAVIEQIHRGTAFSVSHPVELALAQELVETIPCAEMVRYCKGGGEANAVAVRIARGYTGREKVLFCGYHGWHDWYLAANLAEDDVLSSHLLPNIAPRGIPQGLKGTALPFRYNDLDSLETALKRNQGEVACIILEASRGASQPTPGFLEGVRELATAHGVVLIFDEVVTGFRLAMGGAQETFGVVPDLATYAKAISNGYAMGAVVGRKDVMSVAADMFISSTYWSDTVGATAALTTIREMKRRNAIARITETGRAVQQRFNQLAAKHNVPLCAGGLPQQVAITFAEDAPAQRQKQIKDYFVQEMTKRGFFTSFGYNPSYAHDAAAISETAAAWDEVFALLAEALHKDDWDQRLHGEGSIALFRRLVG
ncbi:MAG: aminotransferase class III-fold pyridoxal phosphate-dependent enzyme [Caldilineaceae bacterium]